MSQAPLAPPGARCGLWPLAVGPGRPYPRPACQSGAVVIKSIIGGAAAAALLSGPALAAARQIHAMRASALAWVVTPTDTGCRVDLELAGRSGGVTPVSLISDGQLVSLRFFKEDLPARAFLPIRIDKARFSNLMLRGADGSGELVLSEETEAAMRKGGDAGRGLADRGAAAGLAGRIRTGAGGPADLRRPDRLAPPRPRRRRTGRPRARRGRGPRQGAQRRPARRHQGPDRRRRGPAPPGGGTAERQRRAEAGPRPSSARPRQRAARAYEEARPRGPPARTTTRRAPPRLRGPAGR